MRNMEREIKFRAWFIGTKSMQDWAGVSHRFSHETGYWYFNNPKIILMQNTGLKDKKGVEIYEGDILACEYYKKSGKFNNFVTFIDGMFCMNPNKKLHQVKRPLSKSMQFAKEANNEYEVIGNIYENPELKESI